jgi:hypothetical protein
MEIVSLALRHLLKLYAPVMIKQQSGNIAASSVSGKPRRMRSRLCAKTRITRLFDLATGGGLEG